MKEISLAHGNGGILTSEIINDVILKNLSGRDLKDMNDSAILWNRFGFTTDSFVIFPHFFPGGDIGKLSVCGTVNDLVMSGCEPKYLSLSFILEEGFQIESLEKIVRSVKETCDSCGVEVKTGDTKVVDKGSGSGIYINTTGVGEKLEGVEISRDRMEKGDKIIVTGNIGDHGVAILCEREGILKGQLKSDCMPLIDLLETVKKYPNDIKVMRDPTRGGLATTLNELVDSTEHSCLVYEEEIPVDEKVSGACDIFGLDPMYSANEGKGVLVVSGDKAQDILDDIRASGVFENASIIGEICDTDPGKVLMKGKLGGTRIVSKLTNDMLPRIC